MKNKVSNAQKVAILVDAGWNAALVAALNDKELDRCYRDVCKVVTVAKKVAIKKAKRQSIKDSRATFGVVSPIRKAIDAIKNAYDESVEEINEEQYKARKGIVHALKNAEVAF